MGFYRVKSKVPFIFVFVVILSSNLVYAHADASTGIQPVQIQSVASLPGPQTSISPTTIPFHPINSTTYSTIKSQSTTPQYAQKLSAPVFGPEPYIAPNIVSVSPGGFEGIDETESGGAIPPDVAMAVGPNHVVEFVNFVGQIWDKSGTPIGSVFDLNAFFSAGTDETTDPKILFDSQSGRWFASFFDISSSSVRVAVSNTDNPTGGWTVYNIQFGSGPSSGVCPDQPKIGVSNDKFVVAVTDFANFCVGDFLGADFFVFDKSQMTSGVALTRFSHFGPDLTKSSITPAQSLSPNNALYMASVDFPSSTRVHFFTLTGLPIGLNTGGVTKTLVDLLLPSALTINVPPQAVQATSDLVDTGDNRVLDAKWSQGKMWISLNDACTPLGDTVARSCARLIQINTVRSPTILQDFDIGFSGYYVFYPAISIEGSGSLDVISGYSTPISYPSLFVTGQSTFGAPNTYQSSKAIAFGSTPNTDGRYGDYFSAVIDPSNSTKSWVAGEYMHLPPSFGFSTWSTFIAATTTTNPTLSLNPTSGPVGTAVTVKGGFFDDVSLTKIKYNGVIVNSATVTTDINGNFTTPLTIPSSTFGPHTILATDAVTNTASSTFTVSPAVALSQISGPVGTSTIVTGHGFAASSSTSIKYDGVLKSTVVTNATGSFKMTLPIPQSTIGVHSISATDAVTHTNSASFTVVTGILLNTNSGPVGTSLTVTGNGFAANSLTTIKYNGVTKATVTSSSIGGISSTFIIPPSPAGANTVLVTDSSSNVSTTFTVTPSISLSTSTGPIGSSITITGNGFSANSLITIKYNGIDQATVLSNNDGGFSLPLVIPISTNGAHPVLANDPNSNSASSSFTVMPGIFLGPSSGPVGTSITVTGNGLAPNVSTTIKYDGVAKTTVVTDSDGSLSTTIVVPESKAGPHTVLASNTGGSASATFTVTPSISLSASSGTVGSSVTVTGKGFAAGKATQVKFNTLTVGTVTSNTLGSFTATFTVPSSPSGANTISATNTGGTASGIFNIGTSLNLSKTSGPVDTSIIVTGKGFAPSSPISIKFNNVQQITVSSGVDGSFTGTFSIPEISGGSYPVMASDGSSNTAASSFTVTPMQFLGSMAGPIGTPVAITGKGFAASSTITVKFNSVTKSTITSSNLGSFSTTITIPSTATASNTVSSSDNTNTVSATFTLSMPTTNTVSDVSLQLWTIVSDIQNKLNQLVGPGGPIQQILLKITAVGTPKGISLTMLTTTDQTILSTSSSQEKTGHVSLYNTSPTDTVTVTLDFYDDSNLTTIPIEIPPKDTKTISFGLSGSGDRLDVSASIDNVAVLTGNYWESG